MKRDKKYKKIAEGFYKKHPNKETREFLRNYGYGVYLFAKLYSENYESKRIG